MVIIYDSTHIKYFCTFVVEILHKVEIGSMLSESPPRSNLEQFQFYWDCAAYGAAVSV